MSQDAVDALVKLLDLEPIEVNLFRGLSPDEERQRVFGGQVAGQALVAAARTVEPGRSVHSLHAYFLRPGDPTVPILYEVDRIRDGRSFTTRRVVAIQHGKAIFNLQSSFQVAEEGLDHQDPMPDAPPPEELADFHERMRPWAESMGEWYARPRPIDTRHVNWTPPDHKTPLPPNQEVWLRADGRLPDDPVLHACVLTYASDMTLLDTALNPHRGGWSPPNLFMASLDHAMWFHRPFRADEWLLYSQDTPSASGGRGLGRGRIFTAAGALAVTVVQEGLIRVNRT
ncbi:MAG: acyl-CoA thioesterase II [Acidimicrobiales bacterium]